ncbi:PREDICTED: EF-hand calcium-binding domain-containing protein 9 [Mesitornis unicolor]|uniref:EF-hand calcium-binding domain-containing protein 9 n=1 Tax=Mesitornis unicolor TaxID=54374 RepID=UPI000528716C|nr:PREDICTED: EF-hand calcium-binding domain-containing protein 9 [Mesitornis unicolor]
MKLNSGCFLQHLPLAEVHSLLSVRNAATLAEYFQLLVVHQKNYLDRKRCLRAHCFPDLQFYCFLLYVADLSKDQLVLLFDSVDQNMSGRICFHSHNIQKELQKIFKVFDISGAEKLTYREFRMFAVFYTDNQQQRGRGS